MRTLFLFLFLGLSFVLLIHAPSDHSVLRFNKCIIVVLDASIPTLVPNPPIPVSRSAH